MLLPDLLRVKYASVIWDANENSFVYSSMRDGRLGGATDIIRRHVLGQPQTADRVLVEAIQAKEYFSLSRYGSRYLLARASPEANKLSFVDLATGDEQPIFQTRGGTLLYCASTGASCCLSVSSIRIWEKSSRLTWRTAPLPPWCRRGRCPLTIPVAVQPSSATISTSPMSVTVPMNSSVSRWPPATGMSFPFRTAGTVEIQT